ncbi:potassium channel family protein [Candidatus Nitronereus thalassa]|uniref:Potassium channel family protein n=1 Tax=Candidatus Nitronereus thalassa TaxID=3020898 RepID=A0ABU3KBV7_9BACT|nr:potassium channel family protein [Candidatus Nitronereus thalassa]MDT7043905.1 potassium channel family protein [Candidatus Nitronereus thalassa]
MAPKRSRQLLESVLVMPEDLSPWRTIAIRIGVIILLVVFLITYLWIDREGLKDHADGVITIPDVIYFTMVTITTVGYGDIVPITPQSRLFDAFVITPIRMFIWMLFLGTAYQLALKQFAEGYRMAKVRASLEQHVVVCGIGYTGLATIKELLAKGTNPEQILAIDMRDERVRAAVELGVYAIRGDASKEATLRDAVLEKAKAIIITSGRDDTNALTLLTVRNICPSLRALVSAKEEENVKLLRQAGANTIITPATFGGSMLASAVNQTHLARYMEDLLTSGGRVDLIEEKVRQEDVGKSTLDFLPNVVLRIYRNGKMLSLDEFRKNEPVKEGDIVMLLKHHHAEESST